MQSNAWEMLILASAFDRTLQIAFIAMVVGAPLLGYWFMVCDIRAYLRALRGSLIVVRNHISHLPIWARQYTPGCIRSLGLELPCTEADIKKAYRGLAERMHPDRGGDRQKFMMLQRQFEEALQFVRDDATEHS